MTYYEVLGVAPTADAPTLRRAYLRLARQHHPDFHTVEGKAARSRSERTMQRVNEAWAVLGDEARRREYDRTLLRSARTTSSSGSRSRKPQPAPEPDFDEDDLDRDLDLLDNEALTDAQVKGSWTLLPVGLFFASVAMFSISMVLQAAPLLALSFVVFVLSGLGFIVLPFLAMAGSRRDDLSDGGRA